MFQKITDFIICPRCKKTELSEEKEQIICPHCKNSIPIRDGILIMPVDSEIKYLQELLDKFVLTNLRPYKDLSEYYLITGMKQKIAKILARYIGEEGRFRIIKLLPNYPQLLTSVDLGGGNGFILKHILNHYSSNKIKNIYGIVIDISLEHLKLATPEIKNDQRLFFINGDAENTFIKEESIDLIISTECLEHIVKRDKLEAYFKEIARILKKKGFLFITTPNRDGFSFKFTEYYFPRIVNLIKYNTFWKKTKEEIDKEKEYQKIKQEAERILSFNEVKYYLQRNKLKIVKLEFNHLLPETVFKLWNEYNPPIFLLEMTIFFSQILRVLFNKIKISQYFGFNQVILAEKVN